MQTRSLHDDGARKVEVLNVRMRGLSGEDRCFSLPSASDEPVLAGSILARLLGPGQAGVIVREGAVVPHDAQVNSAAHTYRSVLRVIALPPSPVSETGAEPATELSFSFYGRTLKLAAAHHVVRDAKERLATELHVDAARLRFIVAGRELRDDAVLEPVHVVFTPQLQDVIGVPRFNCKFCESAGAVLRARPVCSVCMSRCVSVGDDTICFAKLTWREVFGLTLGCWVCHGDLLSEDRDPGAPVRAY